MLFYGVYRCRRHRFDISDYSGGGVLKHMLRLRFCKTGKAKFFSHLDLIATMRRAILRSGIKLAYSEGFNPHPYISSAIPLSVGCGSVCEVLDFAAAEQLHYEELPSIITAMLPEGLEVLEAYVPERKFYEIAWIELSGILYYGLGTPKCAIDRLKERYIAESITIRKRTKRGVSDIDIAPFLRGVEFFGTDGLNMKAIVSAQNPTINPDNLISALSGEYIELAPDFSMFTRIGFFDKDMKVFI